jgi:hypothetical protein
MTWRADRDGLEDSWPRVGLSSVPDWAASLPPEWLDVELNFYRETAGGANTIGGFKGHGAKDNYLVTPGHVDLQTDSGFENDLTSGILIRRHYEGVFPVPADLSKVPKKGDRVWWIDALGRRIDTPLRQVDSPEGLRDHLEFESEEFE